MRTGRKGPAAPVVGAIAAFAVALALVWAFAATQAAARGTRLEYEIFRNASVLLEASLQDPSLAAVDPAIRGFGVYGPDGEASLRLGDAPGRLEESELPAAGHSLDIREESAVLIRVLGFEGARGSMGPGMMRGMGIGRGNPPTGDPGSFERVPLRARTVWIDYELGAYRSESTLVLGGASVVTAALLAGALVVIRLAARNRELAAKSARDHELVQLGEAARTLAHEIKNPLGVIRVQTALARKRIARGDPGAADGIAVIESEVARLSGLSDRIGAFLRSDEGTVADIALGPFLADFAGRYAGRCVAAPAVGNVAAAVRMDPERLRGVLDNLARNALEADEKGGAFELAATVRRGQVEIVVSDRGPGVAEADRERVFEPFYTTKPAGSGIGLAISRRWVEVSGGTIRCRVREGGGAEFVVILPLAGAAGSSPGRPGTGA